MLPFFQSHYRGGTVAPAARFFATALLLMVPSVAACSDLPTGVTGDVTLTDPTPSATLFSRPFYAGAFLGEAESRTERIDASLAEFTRMVGKQPALVKTFRTLGEDFSSGGWVGQLMRKISSAGSTNFIALDLRYAGAPGRNLLDAINGGHADAQLRRMAREMKGLGFEILLSPGWEMNGRWNDYAWQGHANGAENGGPAKYAAAFRRMVEIFRSEGATNVKWVFSPNVGNAFTLRASGPEHWNWYGHYYPGDAYVDFLGPHGYNGSSLWGGTYQTFDVMFNGTDADHILTDMERRFPSKKIIISEYASEEVRGRCKGEWIKGAFETMSRHPNVIGAIWFQMNKETDWRINSTGVALDAYRSAMAHPNVRTRFGN